MLWYKAWIETRARFISALVVITFIVGVVVHHVEYVLDPSILYSDLFISRADLYVMGMWLLSVVLFAMGGLTREKAVGVSSFTLALPVSRLRLLGTRVAVGILETVVTAIVPWVVIVAIADRAGKTFPISQAALYLLLLISGGLVYFGLAVLISTLVEGEYTAPALANGITLISIILFGNSSLTDPYLNIGKFMSGGFLFDKRTYLLRPEIPWAPLIACWIVAALMLAGSAGVTNRREL